MQVTQFISKEDIENININKIRQRTHVDVVKNADALEMKVHLNPYNILDMLMSPEIVPYKDTIEQNYIPTNTKVDDIEVSSYEILTTIKVLDPNNPEKRKKMKSDYEVNLKLIQKYQIKIENTPENIQTERVIPDSVQRFMLSEREEKRRFPLREIIHRRAFLLTGNCFGTDYDGSKVFLEVLSDYGLKD
ncbi:hypothetical protein FQA39_LY06061 [Lamprigera yunnana]|nr:hypothetical protein FQA39_LY06061 [Lamprigera yunnana]